MLTRKSMKTNILFEARRSNSMKSDMRGSLAFSGVIVHTRMVTLMALFMLPLYSQPCLDTPPF